MLSANNSSLPSSSSSQFVGLNLSNSEISNMLVSYSQNNDISGVIRTLRGWNYKELLIDIGANIFDDNEIENTEQILNDDSKALLIAILVLLSNNFGLLDSIVTNNTRKDSVFSCLRSAQLDPLREILYGSFKKMAIASRDVLHRYYNYPNRPAEDHQNFINNELQVKFGSTHYARAFDLPISDEANNTLLACLIRYYQLPHSLNLVSVLASTFYNNHSLERLEYRLSNMQYIRCYISEKSHIARTYGNEYIGLLKKNIEMLEALLVPQRFYKEFFMTSLRRGSIPTDNANGELAVVNLPRDLIPDIFQFIIPPEKIWCKKDLLSESRQQSLFATHYIVI